MKAIEIIVCILVFMCMWRIMYLMLRKMSVVNVTTDLFLSFCYTIILFFLAIGSTLFIN